MSADETRLADTRAWLTKARRDLRAGHLALSAEPPLLDDVVFHAQQATEKALKGLLCWHDVPFRKTHSLVELGAQCLPLASALEPLLREAAPLSEYAWRYRYPGPDTEPEASEATAALSLSERLVTAVAALMPEACGS